MIHTPKIIYICVLLLFSIFLSMFLSPKQAKSNSTLLSTAAETEKQAFIQQEQEHFGKADKLFQKALNLRVQALGKFSPEIALTYSFMAELADAQGKMNEAIFLIKKAISIYGKSTEAGGHKHAACYEILAEFYSELDQYDKSVEAYSQAILIRERSLGKSAISLVQFLFEYAEHLRALGRSDKAQEIENRAHGIYANSQVHDTSQPIESPAPPAKPILHEAIETLFPLVGQTSTFARTPERPFEPIRLQGYNPIQCTKKIINRKITSLICPVPFSIAEHMIVEAYEAYPDQKGGVGTGTYVWCDGGKEIEIYANQGEQSYFKFSSVCIAEQEETNLKEATVPSTNLFSWHCLGESCEYSLNDTPLGRNRAGINTLLYKMNLLPKDSKLKIQPYLGDPGGTAQKSYPFDLPALIKHGKRNGVQVLVPNPK